MIGRYGQKGKYKELLQKKEFYTVAAGGLLILASFLLGKQQLSLPAAAAALAAVVLLGGPIVWGAARGLLRKEVNVDELVSLAIVAAVATGEYLPAAVVALLMTIGSLAEQFTTRQARSAIFELMSLAPETAAVIREGREMVLPVGEIQVGDRVLVRTGDRIPIDGRVTGGTASINQASLTGESMPVEKASGDAVHAGTVVYSGMLEVSAEKVGRETTLGRLISLVREAERQKAPIIRVADRYARYFTPAVILAAAAALLITRDLHRAITVLIVGCPCAFILASPTAIVAALGNAARSGILVKGGAVLEEASRISAVIFDKTGTLTTGKPVLAGLRPLNGYSEEQVLAAAAAVEAQSRHPLARAVVEAAEQRRLEVCAAEEYRALPGRGVTALVKGKRYYVGAADGGGEPGEEKGEMLEPDAAPDGAGALLVREDDMPAGIIYVREELRQEAPEAVAQLRRAGLDRIIMLSGDSHAAAARAAAAAGIDEFYSSMLPEGKLRLLRELQQSGAKVVMVGDGVNDAPSLAAADLGVAMGAMGTAAAMEAADVALLGDDLGKVPYLLRLGRLAVRTININIVFAVAFNLLALIASGAGLLGPVTGALAHNAGSILVVANSARLLKKRV